MAPASNLPVEMGFRQLRAVDPVALLQADDARPELRQAQADRRAGGAGADHEDVRLRLRAHALRQSGGMERTRARRLESNAFMELPRVGDELLHPVSTSMAASTLGCP